MNAVVKTFGELTVGTVINYSNMTTAQDTDYVVLYQYEDQWGKWTKVLNKETNEVDMFAQHTKTEIRWRIVKEN